MFRIILVSMALCLSTPAEAKSAGALTWFICEVLKQCTKNSSFDPEEIEQYFENGNCIGPDGTWQTCEGEPEWLQGNEMLAVVWDRIEILALQPTSD